MRVISKLFSFLKPRRCAMALLGSAILAFGLCNIHEFSGVTEGGVLGLTLLLNQWFGISPAVSSLILNGLCYLLGFRLLGKEFIAYSIVAGGSYSAFYAVFERFAPIWPWITEHPLCASLAGAVFVGVGVGLCVRAGGAPGGDDALAMSLSHLTHLDIQWIYLASDLIVLALSLTYIPLKRMFFSLLTVILSGQLIGLVQKAGTGKKQAPAESAADV